MRLVAALVLPPLLTLTIAVGAVRLVGGLSVAPQTHAHGIVWGKRTFVNRAELGRWLNSQGRSYEVWAQRHPASAPAATARADGPAAHRSFLLAGISVLSLGGLALLVRRRRSRPPLARRPSLPRPRVGWSYARVQSATILAWRGHPDLAWYVAGGALAVGAGLVVAGWG
jgi:LPXTG-motif cell wall-anchored protein